MNILPKSTLELLAKLKEKLEYEKATDFQIIIHLLADVLTLFITSDNDLKRNPRYFSCVDEALQVIASFIKHSDGFILCAWLYQFMKDNDYLK